MLSSETVSCGILMLLCLAGVSTAQSFDDGRDQAAAIDDIQGVLRSVHALMPESDDDDGPTVNAACRCGGDTCSCCQRISVRLIGLNRDACLGATYLRREIGIRVTLKLGSATIISQTASLSKMAQACGRVPFLSKAASVCLQLKLSPGKGSVRGCATLTAKLLNKTVARIPFSCFTLRIFGSPGAAGVGLPYSDDDGSHWSRTQRDSALPDLEDSLAAAKMEDPSERHFDNI